MSYSWISGRCAKCGDFFEYKSEKVPKISQLNGIGEDPICYSCVIKFNLNIIMTGVLDDFVVVDPDAYPKRDMELL